MSDIHGCYDELMKMLDKINFSSEDNLIIAGDYIDRGIQSFEMLEWISHALDNVILVKGNHDIEFCEYVKLMEALKKRFISQILDDNPDHTRKLVEVASQIAYEYGMYFDYYGTIEDLVRSRDVTLTQMKEWSEVLSELPFFYETDVNGKHFIIVHAGYIKPEELVGRLSVEDFYIYSREDAYRIGGKKDSVIIAGHTPTISEDRITYTGGRIFRMNNEKRTAHIMMLTAVQFFGSSNQREIWPVSDWMMRQNSICMIISKALLKDIVLIGKTPAEADWKRYNYLGRDEKTTGVD